ncbi:MAG TPA: MarR family transcriptional regulator [Acidisoma sp.]|jgi:MarR family transcriptional regulator for hemolysin|uniref:MarR family winged helix-turn-helix transcriptional regulator n=1 Tax=Acidisoma sp. TaxID=1872115 RepID=UPI002CA7230C|nr:MarR family transcriptional regulator [Acidisoma sp.]HTI03107.1 MarR family transcriptional regulator [Acidisoma sp.]
MPATAVRATEFGRQIYRVSLAWRREIDLRVRDFGLTEATWRPLLYLGRLGDGLRQTDLATALMIEGASLVRLVDALERAGLAERLEDPEDRRSKRVWMTPAGRETYEKVAAIHVKVAESMVQDVTPEELAVCDSVLNRILGTIAMYGGAEADADEADADGVDTSA